MSEIIKIIKKSKNISENIDVRKKVAEIVPTSRPVFRFMDKSLDYTNGHDAELAVANLLKKSETSGKIHLLRPIPGSVKPILEKKIPEKLQKVIETLPELRDAQKIDMQLLDYVCGVDVTPFLLEDELNLPENEQHVFFIDVFHFSSYEQNLAYSGIEKKLRKKENTHNLAKSALQEIFELENEDQIITLVLVVDTAITEDMSMESIAKYAINKNVQVVYLSNI